MDITRFGGWDSTEAAHVQLNRRKLHPWTMASSTASTDEVPPLHSTYTRTRDHR